MKKSVPTVQSIDRALRLLECFTLENPQRSVTELSQLTSLSKSTVFRLLATLEQNGYIQQDLVSQKYSLGFKLFHLGAVVMGNMDLRSSALPFMRKLSEETSETVDLNVIDQGERVCIEKIESREIVRNFVRVGQRNCLWLGASGKVLLANLPQHEIKQIIESAIKVGQFQGSEESLYKELSMIREDGFALSKEERIKGSFSVAAPVFDYSSQLVGGIAIAGPIQRLSEERIPILTEKILIVAKEISRTMGYSRNENLANGEE
ncbi:MULTISPECIES: IclR family transcriptional regulator [Cytobacillus]|uniref:IclR family transcriptional regulator n=1 Tax=Cytobacillus TaxID=2675230 RepID=UPI0020407A05|nr:IclR family transcriptional regulator [Cytobacillus firmus]MCM3708456.1 IclR family transcriptional regulator [Cytobacillus firmus]